MSRFKSHSERAIALSEFDSKHLALVLIEVSELPEARRLFSEFCQLLDPIISATDAETQGRLCDVVNIARALAASQRRDFDASTLADEKPQTLAVLLALAARLNTGCEGDWFATKVIGYAQTFCRLMSITDGETSETAAKVVAISELLVEWVWPERFQR